MTEQQDTPADQAVEQAAEEVRVIDDAATVLELIDLRGFRTFELSGRRRDGSFVDVDPPAEDAETVTHIEPIDREMQLFVSEDLGRASVRIRTEVEAPMCVVVVDMAVLYTKSDPFMMGEGAKEAFVQRLAIMNLWPFVRQHVADVSQRLDAGTTLGIIRPGGQLVLEKQALDADAPDPAWIAEQSGPAD